MTEEGDFSTFFDDNKLDTENKALRVRNQNTGLVQSEDFGQNTLADSIDKDNTKRDPKHRNLSSINDNNTIIANDKEDLSISNPIVTDIEVQSNKKLELIDTEGLVISEKKLLINAGGLCKGGLRNCKDGWTNFGPAKKDRNGNIINDYILSIQTKHSVPTIFKIFFNRIEKQYYLFCEHSEDDLIILFVKLEKPFVNLFDIIRFRNSLKSTSFL